MITVIFSKPEWLENCRDCQVPMRKMMKEQGDQVTGIPGTLGWEIGLPIRDGKPRQAPQGYDLWVKSPSVDDFWYCERCETLWGKCLGNWWAKCGGQYTLTILPQPKDIPVWIPPVDPGPRPYNNSTKCPQCHIWREFVKVMSYNEDLGIRIVLQRCPRCENGEQIVEDANPMGITLGPAMDVNDLMA